MRLYETTFILSPGLEEADLEKNIQRYTKIITHRGGTIEKEERWGTRRLAYEINRKSQGYYVHLIHNSNPETPSELERQFLLNEHCLRHLTVVAPRPVPEPQPEPERTETTTASSAKTSAEAKPEEQPSPAAEKAEAPTETEETPGTASSETAAESKTE